MVICHDFTRELRPTKGETMINMAFRQLATQAPLVRPDRWKQIPLAEQIVISGASLRGHIRLENRVILECKSADQIAPEYRATR